MLHRTPLGTSINIGIQIWDLLYSELSVLVDQCRPMGRREKIPATYSQMAELAELARRLSSPKWQGLRGALSQSVVSTYQQCSKEG